MGKTAPKSQDIDFLPKRASGVIGINSAIRPHLTDFVDTFVDNSVEKNAKCG
jgi:hypothetical protein